MRSCAVPAEACVTHILCSLISRMLSLGTCSTLEAHIRHPLPIRSAFETLIQPPPIDVNPSLRSCATRVSHDSPAPNCISEDHIVLGDLLAYTLTSSFGIEHGSWVIHHQCDCLQGSASTHVALALFWLVCLIYKHPCLFYALAYLFALMSSSCVPLLHTLSPSEYSYVKPPAYLP